MEMAYIPITEVFIRLTMAAGLAFILGLERELKGKSFGLRTHMLLSLGTAAFVLIAMELTHTMVPKAELVQLDPMRIIEAIIAGISFLGAGSIIRSDDSIKGATTGAGIWVLGGIGLAAGLGLYILAVLITMMVLFIVAVLNPFDRWLAKRVTDQQD